MMPQSGTLPARLSALLILVVLAAALWTILVQPLVSAYTDRFVEVRQLRSQMSNLNGRDRNAGDLARNFDQLKAQLADRALVLPATSDGGATAQIQRRVEQLLGEAGARLSSVQALPPLSADGLRRVGLRLQFSADTPSLQAILHDLEFGRPALVLENVFIHARSDRAVGVVRPLTVRLDIFAFLLGKTANADR
jgi:hypothetical protein